MNELEKLKQELKEKGKVKILQFLRYIRKEKDYEIETEVIIGFNDEELNSVVKRTLRRAKQRGAVYFEGKFEELPTEERSRIYDEAKRKATKWYEVWCDECLSPVSLFDTDVYRVGEDETWCGDCLSERYFGGDEWLNDQLLADAIKRRKPFFKRTGYNDTIIVAKEGRRKVDLISEKKYPLALKAIKESGKEVK